MDRYRCLVCGHTWKKNLATCLTNNSCTKCHTWNYDDNGKPLVEDINRNSIAAEGFRMFMYAVAMIVLILGAIIFV